MNKETKSAIHWALIRLREPITANDRKNDDDFVDMQALNCPWYIPLEGDWGSDWGAIVHPQSQKFGHLVFEHEWCGCNVPNLPHKYDRVCVHLGVVQSPIVGLNPIQAEVQNILQRLYDLFPQIPDEPEAETIFKLGNLNKLCQG